MADREEVERTKFQIEAGAQLWYQFSCTFGKSFPQGRRFFAQSAVA
jgi:hypothetical protein